MYFLFIRNEMEIFLVGPSSFILSRLCESCGDTCHMASPLKIVGYVKCSGIQLQLPLHLHQYYFLFHSIHFLSWYFTLHIYAPSAPVHHCNAVRCTYYLMPKKKGPLQFEMALGCLTLDFHFINTIFHASSWDAYKAIFSFFFFGSFFFFLLLFVRFECE